MSKQYWCMYAEFTFVLHLWLCATKQPLPAASLDWQAVKNRKWRRCRAAVRLKHKTQKAPPWEARFKHPNASEKKTHKTYHLFCSVNPVKETLLEFKHHQAVAIWTKEVFFPLWQLLPDHFWSIITRIVRFLLKDCTERTAVKSTPIKSYSLQDSEELIFTANFRIVSVTASYWKQISPIFIPAFHFFQ